MPTASLDGQMVTVKLEPSEHVRLAVAQAQKQIPQAVQPLPIIHPLIKCGQNDPGDAHPGISTVVPSKSHTGTLSYHRNRPRHCNTSLALLLMRRRITKEKPMPERKAFTR